MSGTCHTRFKFTSLVLAILHLSLHVWYLDLDHLTLQVWYLRLGTFKLGAGLVHLSLGWRSHINLATLVLAILHLSLLVWYLDLDHLSLQAWYLSC